jgi:tRNA dimethylallyltransferase
VWQTSTGSNFLEAFHIESHLLMPPRDELYAACDKRFLTMMEKGAADEVKRFLKRKIDASLPAAKTIGVRELAAFLEGDISREEAIAQSQQATRNYAKRQMTWFRNQKLGFMAH